MQKYIFEVLSEDENRIDKYLDNKLVDMSRSFLQKAIKENKVLVNGKLVKSNYKVKQGDSVQLEISDAVEPDILPEDIPLDVLYEDVDILVVNKPKGMVVHPAAGHYTGTLVNAILYHCKDSLSGINGVMRPGIVHRIDMDTTGSLVVCKNDYAHQYISDLLKTHDITRKYHAIVHGVIKEESGTIHAPIGRHPIDRKKMSINEKNGKDAITHFRVLRRFENHTYIECELETGRTHQIRVHMASIRHPLLGDTVYSNAKTKYKLQGQTLHAMTLGFVHPRSEKYCEFCAPLPDYFLKLLNIL